MLGSLKLSWNVRRLDSEYWGVRQKAAAALARLGDPRAIPPLRFRIGDPVPEVAVEVEKALRHLGVAKQKLINLYLEFLDHGAQFESFQNIVEALKRLRANPDEMVTAYYRALRNTSSPSVLFNSIEALGDSGSEKAIDALLAVESDLSSDRITNQLLHEALAKLQAK